MLPSPKRATMTPDPLALTVKLVNLVPPHMSLPLFELFLLHWSPERVSLFTNKSEQALKRNTQDYSHPTSHPDGVPEDFHSQLCSEQWGSELGSLLWDRKPLFLSGKLLQLRYPFPFLIATLWVRDLSLPHLCSSYQSLCGFFFISLVTGHQFS